MQMVNNYGSLLQSYGLKKIVEKLGGEVEFINIKRIDEDYILRNNEFVKFSDENDSKTKLQKLFDKNIVTRLKNKKVNRRFVRYCEKFRKEYLGIDKRSNDYELCVIGSDEVFNCMSSEWWGYTSQLFGNVPEAKKVITYAASCGATKYDDVPLKVKESIGKTLKKISAFSVRDENTKLFLDEFGINNVITNLDPVLIYDFEEEVNGVTVLPKLPEHYCVIYGYSYRFYKENEINAIQLFCKKHNLVPIILQGGQTWCEKFYACTPFECLKIFKNADFVITDTFHGTIFSIKYANKFAIITRASNYNKLRDLVTRMKIERHLVTNIEDIENIYQMEKEQKTIDDIISSERNKTIKYLEKYINEKE